MNSAVDMRQLTTALVDAREGTGEVRAALLSASFRPRLPGLTKIVSKLAKEGSWRKALEVYEAVEELGLRPDTALTNSAISACDKGARWQKALEIFDRMEALRLPRDAITYSATISALAKGKQWHAALQVFDHMQAAGVEADVVTCCSLINALERGGQWQLAEKLFLQMCTVQEADGMPFQMNEDGPTYLSSSNMLFVTEPMQSRTPVSHAAATFNSPNNGLKRSLTSPSAGMGHVLRTSSGLSQSGAVPFHMMPNLPAVTESSAAISMLSPICSESLLMENSNVIVKREGTHGVTLEPAASMAQMKRSPSVTRTNSNDSGAVNATEDQAKIRILSESKELEASVDTFVQSDVGGFGAQSVKSATPDSTPGEDNKACARISSFPLALNRTISASPSDSALVDRPASAAGSSQFGSSPWVASASDGGSGKYSVVFDGRTTSSSSHEHAASFQNVSESLASGSVESGGFGFLPMHANANPMDNYGVTALSRLSRNGSFRMGGSDPQQVAAAAHLRRAMSCFPDVDSTEIGGGGFASMFNFSHAAKVAPNRVCCNALLAAYARAKPPQWQKALHLLDAMWAGGPTLVPDAVSYNTVMKACANAFQVSEANT